MTPHQRYRVIHVAEPAVDGVKSYYIALLQHGTRECFDFQLLYSDVRIDSHFDRDLAACEANGVRHSVLRISPSISPIADLKALWQLYRALKREKPDVVHLHSSKAGLLGRLAAVLAGIPVRVYTPNAFAFQGDCHPLSRKFYIVIEKLATRFTSKVICVSQSELDEAAGYGVLTAEQGEVIPNAVDAGRVPPFDLAQRNAKRAELGLQEDDLVVLTVGRMSAQKNPHDFVRAAAQVLKKSPNIQFVHVGTGEFEEELRSLAAELGISENLKFLGYRHDVMELNLMADIFVLPSRYEGMPFSLLEAMLCDLAVIATDVTGNRDVIEHDTSGLLAPFGDAAAIAQHIIALSEDPGRRTQLARAARTRVLEAFSIESMVARTENLYLRLLNHRQTPGQAQMLDVKQAIAETVAIQSPAYSAAGKPVARTDVNQAA